MIGTRLGPYEITAKLGEGGMGEVYRATDTNLQRDVAIKVLPEAFTEDKTRLDRFAREARLLAQLHHPHIASIFGLERAGGAQALVMELVEGPTLAERLHRPGASPLPLEETLEIAHQIAQALEEAHEKGIIHRDLKPQNVKLTPDGKVKVLDFGLAKALDPTAGDAVSALASPTLLNSPTLTAQPGTQLGVILGTAAYMAPEQARGQAVDKRADIWAFGVVLYEMLTGERLFAAETVTDTLAAVIRADIDLARLPGSTPPAIRTLLRRCLDRRPQNRLRDIGDARIVLSDVLSDPRALDAAAAPTAEGLGPQPRRRAIAPVLAALAGVLVGAALVAWISGILRGAPEGGGETRLVALVASGESSWPAFSPDGGTIAFGSVRDGVNRIWVQDLRSGSESAVSGPWASSPRYSPDGASLLFTHTEESAAEIHRVNLIGGDERRLVPNAFDGDWSPDGRSIAFARPPSEESPTYQLGVVPTAGGAPRFLASTRAALANPRWSPDGGTIAVAHVASSTGIPDEVLLIAPDSGIERRFGVVRSDGVPLRLAGLAWLDARRLVVLAGDLEAAAFRSSSGRLAILDTTSGRLETLLPLPDVWRGVDVAPDGRILVTTGAVSQNLAIGPLAPEPGAQPRWLTEGSFSDRQPTWSPNGSTVLFSSDRSGNLDLWSASVESGALTRITFDPGEDWDPAWSPDGTQILFSSNRSGEFQVWIADADGSSPRQVTRDVNAQNPTMTADGHWIVYNSFDPDPERRGVWKIRPDGSEPTLLVASDANVPDVSRDGRYVAYRGETQESETRIVRIADGSDIGFSTRGVSRLRWLPGGEPTLAMLTADGRVVARSSNVNGLIVLRQIGPQGAVGPERRIGPTASSREAETFDFSPDGQQVVFSTTRAIRSRIFLVEGLIERD